MMPIPVYLLAASVAINAALGVAWQRAGNQARELQAQIVAVTGERDHALQSAQACSDGLARLQALAERREREAAAARRQAAQAAAEHARRADEVLAAPPAVPGDDCASAKARVQNWLKARE